MKHLAGRNTRSPRARLVAVVALAAACMAQTPLPERGTQADQDACTPDVFRLCSDMIPDEPQILACLQSKRTQLSPACGKVLEPAEKPHHRRRGPSRM